MKENNITPEAQWLHAERKHLGLTQHRVAAELGINQAYISWWEHGKLRIPQDAKADLSRWFNQLHRQAQTLH